MQQMVKLRLLCPMLMMGLLSMPALRAAAQEDTTSKPAPPPAIVVTQAPLPEQIITAKKVFISNGGGALDYRTEDAIAIEESPDYWISGGPNRAYNHFYAAMKDWGRYELVAAPADADLAFEIRYIIPTGASDGQLRLIIFDTRTRLSLWTLVEVIGRHNRKVHRDENVDKALNKLMADVKQLVEPTAQAPTPLKPSAPGPSWR